MLIIDVYFVISPFKNNNIVCICPTYLSRIAIGSNYNFVLMALANYKAKAL